VAASMPLCFPLSRPQVTDGLLSAEGVSGAAGSVLRSQVSVVARHVIEAMVCGRLAINH
jgi:hypothetical protein